MKLWGREAVPVVCFIREFVKRAKRLPSAGSCRRKPTEGGGNSSRHLAALSRSPFGHSLRSCPRTLVGIWSSCFAAACNTPYSARFSPRFIVHRTRSARIPRKRGQLLVYPILSASPYPVYRTPSARGRVRLLFYPRRPRRRFLCSAASAVRAGTF